MGRRYNTRITPEQIAKVEAISQKEMEEGIFDYKRTHFKNISKALYDPFLQPKYRLAKELDFKSETELGITMKNGNKYLVTCIVRSIKPGAKNAYYLYDSNNTKLLSYTNQSNVINKILELNNIANI